MKAVILCGGRGTRLREVSEVLPKPMVHVGNRPILWHIMKIYSSHGINDFVLLLGYKGNVIRDYFLNFAMHTADVTIDLSKTDSQRLEFHTKTHEPWKVTLVDTGDEVMTGARIFRARNFLQDNDYFCVTYGDGVGDIDISSAIKFHRNHGKIATLTGVQAPGRFGELKTELDTVRAFNEKPQVSGGYINGGFFVFSQNMVNKYLEDDSTLVLEQSPMERLVADKQLKIFKHDGFWQPMDTPREHSLLNELWSNGSAPWKVW